MSILTKQPAETLVLFIEFADELSSGDSLASITSVTEATSGITISSTSITGTKVKGTYAGGTDGTAYHIVAIVTTTLGETLEADVYLLVTDSPTTSYTTSYFTLLEEIGEYLFGVSSGYIADQIRKIEKCMEHGIKRVHAAHEWSFLKPLKDVLTTPPYTTGTIEVVDGVVTLTGGTFPSWASDGTLKASDDYYSIASRDSNTQVTLNDTSVDIAAGATYQLARPEIPLDASFEDLVGDRLAHYYPGASECYPPIQNVHDQQIRTWQQRNPYFDRPARYAVRIAEFDPTVGSRKRLVFYPTPDAQYVIRVPMSLRPTMITATSPFPVGGEQLSQLFVEACLASAEHNFEERDHVHEARFREMLPMAIARDQERSSPSTLGPDLPRGERGYGLYDGDYWRARRMGGISLGGVEL